jgi:hypothetical protein
MTDPREQLTKAEQRFENESRKRLDTSRHDRRLAQRLEDPEFAAAFYVERGQWYVSACPGCQRQRPSDSGPYCWMCSDEGTAYAAQRVVPASVLADLLPHVERLSGMSGGSLPLDEPWSSDEREVNDAIRAAKDALK